MKVISDYVVIYEDDNYVECIGIFNNYKDAYFEAMMQICEEFESYIYSPEPGKKLPEVTITYFGETDCNTGVGIEYKSDIHKDDHARIYILFKEKDVSAE